MEVRLKEKYNKEIVGSLSEKLGRKNAMSLPKVVKIVVNCGVGKFKEDKSYVENTIRDLGLITGQKPLAKKAKQSIVTSRLRILSILFGLISGKILCSFRPIV